MPKWKYSTNVLLTFLIIIVKITQGEVTLRVLLRPPMVELECLIINTAQKASVFLNCPNDIMCFKNCERMCEKNCFTNNITCIESAIGNGMKFTFTFDTSNVQNQGEWTCHFGTQQSSTVIFYNETLRKTPTVTHITPSSTAVPATSKLSVLSSQTSNFLRLTNRPRKSHTLVSETNVIILLAVFVISICVNVYFLSRCLCCKFFPKSVEPRSHERKSCFLTLCIKLFCLEKLYKKKSMSRSAKDRKHTPQRQVSSNVYEFSPSSQMQPAVLLDNYAFISTPTNHRMVPSGMYVRSQSFPSKSVGGITGANTMFANGSVRQPFTQLLPSHEGVSQIIYDDVPEQSISYMPANYVDRATRPSQYINLNGTLGRILAPTAMSMNNLATSGYRLPDMAQPLEEPNEEAFLKDAISSRVELSKEMISQADCLLRRADSLLNEKEHQSGTTS